MGHRANAVYIIVSGLLLGVGSPAHSQQNAVAIGIGESKLYPSVGLSFENNDNTYFTNSDAVQSTAIIVSPKMDWIADRRLLTLQGTYSGAYSSSSESNLNYTDHNLGFNAKANLSKKNRLSARLYFTKGHQAFGTGFTSTESTTLLRQTIVNELGSVFRYTYGVRGAKGNITLGLDLLNRSFEDQPELTVGRDYFKIQTNAVFSLRLFPETRLLTEARIADFGYDDNQFDRQDTSFLIGASFEPNSKYGGAVKVGITDASFSDTSTEDSSFGIIELDLFYAPRSYSKFNFGADRRFDSDNTSDVLSTSAQAVRETFSVNWRHDWNNRYSTVADLVRTAVKRECPGVSYVSTSVGLSLKFKPRRWLEFGLGATSFIRAEQFCDMPDDADLERVTSAFTLSAML